MIPQQTKEGIPPKRANGKIKRGSPGGAKGAKKYFYSTKSYNEPVPNGEEV
jgi:hypothetical protein